VTGKSVEGTHLEIGTIEGAVRIDDHEADAPFEEGLLVELGILSAYGTNKGVRKTSRTSMLTHFSCWSSLNSLIKRCFAPMADMIEP
jgi:hypothetical protein